MGILPARRADLLYCSWYSKSPSKSTRKGFAFLSIHHVRYRFFSMRDCCFILKVSGKATAILNHCDFIYFSVICHKFLFNFRSIFNSPCVWWWHTKCGMLAIPMSSLKKYRWLIFIFVIACLITGILWNVMESWRHIILVDILEIEFGVARDIIRAKTFVYIIGSLCAVPVILNGEFLIDIIGHPHVIVLTLLTFAIRFTGLSLDYLSPCNTFYEFLEPISYYLSWFGYLLIIRHYVPKKFLCGGSGVFIAVYFLLGRAIGFGFGASTDYELYNQSHIFLYYAVFTICIASLFFVVYHCLTCVGTEVSNEDLSRGDQPDGKSQGRVFHDERSKKGYFKYWNYAKWQKYFYRDILYVLYIVFVI